jgi:hypothetical protein
MDVDLFIVYKIHEKKEFNVCSELCIFLILFFLYLRYQNYVLLILFVCWTVEELILLGQTIREMSVIYPSNI